MVNTVRDLSSGVTGILGTILAARSAEEQISWAIGVAVGLLSAINLAIAAYQKIKKGRD